MMPAKSRPTNKSKVAPLQEPQVRYTYWRYMPVNSLPISPRLDPNIEDMPLDLEIEPGTVLKVCQEQRGADGILYLKLADEVGWIFEEKPEVGIMCVRHDAELGRNSTAEEQAPRITMGVEEIRKIMDVFQDDSVLTHGVLRSQHGALLSCLGKLSEDLAERQEDLCELRNSLNMIQRSVGQAITLAQTCLLEILSELKPDRRHAAIHALCDWSEEIQRWSSHERAGLASLVRIILQRSSKVPRDRAEEVEADLLRPPQQRTEFMQKYLSALASEWASTVLEELGNTPPLHCALVFPEADMMLSLDATLHEKETLLQKVESAIAAVHKLASIDPAASAADDNQSGEESMDV